MTGLEYLIQQVKSKEWQDMYIWQKEEIFDTALRMTSENYTKEDVLMAGEIGEINHHDYKHLVSLLDEAKIKNKNKQI